MPFKLNKNLNVLNGKYRGTFSMHAFINNRGCIILVKFSLVPRPSFWWVWPHPPEGGSGHETRSS